MLQKDAFYLKLQGLFGEQSAFCPFISNQHIQDLKVSPTPKYHFNINEWKAKVVITQLLYPLPRNHTFRKEKSKAF